MKPEINIVFCVHYSTIFNPIGMKEFINRKDAVDFRTFCLCNKISVGKIIKQVRQLDSK